MRSNVAYKLDETEEDIKNYLSFSLELSPEFEVIPGSRGEKRKVATEEKVLNPELNRVFELKDLSGSLKQSSLYERLLKRMADVLVAVAVLVIVSPILLMVALCIKYESAGPVIFKQRRVGRDGKPFEFYKFRSMKDNCIGVEELTLALRSDREGICAKYRVDPRVTGVGRIIRKYSIDELPQLVNVIFGKMSLVGPRPAMLKEVEKYNVNEKRRLAVVPGITGLWQISGRADLSFDEQILLDLEYIDSVSLLTDLKILILTIPAVLFCKGAY